LVGRLIAAASMPQACAAPHRGLQASILREASIMPRTAASVTGDACDRMHKGQLASTLASSSSRARLDNGPASASRDCRLDHLKKRGLLLILSQKRAFTRHRQNFAFKLCTLRSVDLSSSESVTLLRAAARGFSRF
jgi:hypothetical protein